jgi:hypothetical protein
MQLRVECRSEHKADERPVRFYLGEREHQIHEVLDQWYGPNDIFFKVLAEDGNVYILRHGTSVPGEDWELVSFRKAG